MNHKHLSFMFMLVLLLLVGSAIAACGSATPPASSSASAPPAATPSSVPQAAPLTAVDWQNFTYTSSCFSDKPQQFVVRDGMGVLNGVHLQVYTPVYGE